MTPGFLPNHPGGSEKSELGNLRIKQYWKGLGIKLSILTILTLRFLLHIKMETLRKQNDKQVWS